MAHEQWEFEDKALKFYGKTPHECYKLIWQWAREKVIRLSLFEALCEYVTLETRDPK